VRLRRDALRVVIRSVKSPLPPASSDGLTVSRSVARVDPNCRFCQIVAGDEAAHVVLEDEQTLAFLDNRPLFHGHTLLVPRDHYEALADLPDELIPPLFAAARLLSKAVPEAMGKPGAFVAINNIVSQSVPHLHVHVVPRKPKDGLRGFFWPRTKYESEDQMKEVAARVRKAAEVAT
jgi:histidine triad (HIT) family protein